MTKRIYFAHPMVDYDTGREGLALGSIQHELGLDLCDEVEVLNPNHPDHQAGYDALVAAGDPDPFRYWEELAVSCHGVAFMCMPGKGRLIGSGVAKEVERATAAGKPVWEVDRHYLAVRQSSLDDVRGRFMSIEATRLFTGMLMQWRSGL